MARPPLIVALAAALGVGVGCASLLWVRPLVVDDYPSAHVRIYRNGSKCRLEVITAAETLQTIPTHCWTVPTMRR